jgi:O-antigen ligase
VIKIDNKSSWSNKSINYLLILFAFLLPISTAMTNAAVALLILFWLIEGRWKEKYIVLRSSLPFKLFLAFILLIGLSILWSHGIEGGFWGNKSPNAIVFYVRQYIFDFMIIPIILTSMKKEFIRYIISSFLAAILVSELMSWGIFMEWIQYKNVLPDDPSPFMNHSFYSIFLAVTIFVLLTRFFQTKTTLYKILIVLFILSAIVNLFLNGGRLGQLAFFVAIFVYTGLRYRVTIKSTLLSLLTVIMVFTIAYKVSPVFQKRMDSSLQSLTKILEGNYNSSWGKRVHILIVAKDLVRENPIFGIGMGNAKVEFLEKAKEYPQNRDFFLEAAHLHNGYMQILVEVGIIGLLLFFFFIYTLLRARMKRDDYILLVMVITIYLIGFVGEPLFFNRKPYLLFNLFIAILLFKSMYGAKEKEALE